MFLLLALNNRIVATANMTLLKDILPNFIYFFISKHHKVWFFIKVKWVHNENVFTLDSQKWNVLLLLPRSIYVYVQSPLRKILIKIYIYLSTIRTWKSCKIEIILILTNLFTPFVPNTPFLGFLMSSEGR